MKGPDRNFFSPSAKIVMERKTKNEHKKISSINFSFKEIEREKKKRLANNGK